MGREWWMRGWESSGGSGGTTCDDGDNGVGNGGGGDMTATMTANVKSTMSLAAS